MKARLFFSAVWALQLLLTHLALAGWHWQNPWPQPHELHDFYFVDANCGWVTGRNGTILRTTDGGATWHPQTTRTWYDISSVCFIDVNTGWVSGDYGAIMATEDGGGITALPPVGEMRVPAGFELYQNYPNPFNPGTVISYQLSAVSDVKLRIFDVLGRQVCTLVDARQGAGRYEVKWNNGRNGYGLAVASGVYFCRMEAGKFRQSIKLLLLR